MDISRNAARWFGRLTTSQGQKETLSPTLVFPATITTLAVSQLVEKPLLGSLEAAAIERTCPGARLPSNPTCVWLRSHQEDPIILPSGIS